MANAIKSNKAVITQNVFFPACTRDYRVVNGKHGFGIVANRNIKKGTLVFENSLEFDFSDVIDGDSLLLDRCKKASRKGRTAVPHYFPLTRKTLMHSHGIEYLFPDPSGQSAIVKRDLLEVPGMLMNHSCDPNVIDCVTSEEDEEDIEAYATRDIRKGEELTTDYALSCFDEVNVGTVWEDCRCGVASCRKQIKGFIGLSDMEKKKLFPVATRCVQAQYMALIGKGPVVTVSDDNFLPRAPPADNCKVPRLVFPGPGAFQQTIAVRKIATGRGEFGLFAMKDFGKGEMVYECWCQNWPEMLPGSFDLVFATPVSEVDPPEGTTVRIKAPMQKPRSEWKFSGWDMLIAQSSEPNIVYSDDDEDEDWREAFAARAIKAGEQLMANNNKDEDLKLLLRGRKTDSQDVKKSHCIVDEAEALAASVQVILFRNQEEKIEDLTESGSSSVEESSSDESDDD